MNHKNTHLQKGDKLLANDNEVECWNDGQQTHSWNGNTSLDNINEVDPWNDVW